MSQGNPVIEDKVADALTLRPIPPNDHEAAGIKLSLTLGETFAVMETGFIESDGRVWRSDASAAGTMPASVMVLEAGAAEASVRCLLIGTARDETWTWSVGGVIYASDTEGELTQTAPSGSGDQVQAVGIATHEDRMVFNPSYVLVEVA